MSKSKLNCWDLSYYVQFVMKTRQHNDVIDYIGVVYDEKETKLSNVSNRV